ncbi:odorant-binding protein-like [Arvicanthis niloticus]|uniref:odorant-binding protein-like n=1 Tax=Arvicanthis niloticus TaxID=61156 RepID=UPI001486843E|nr:odorant-binding protein-like [Arvicanthis niloticus]
MVKFLLIALALGMSCAHHESLDLNPSEVNGTWHTLYIAANPVDKVVVGGPLRAYFEHMECSDECQTIKIKFNVKVDGECQTHTVVGEKQEDGRYTTDYSGRNYFRPVLKKEDTIFFHNVNVDETGKETNVILVAGKEETLSKAQKQELRKLSKKYNIPKENIQHLVPTDTCSQ